MQEAALKTPFDKSPFFAAIKSRDTAKFLSLLNDPKTKLTDLKLLNAADRYGTYIHLAVDSRCDAAVIEGLIKHGAPVSHRNTERQNFMDVMLQTNYPFTLQVSKFVCGYVMDALKEGTVEVIRELTRDMWTHWPIRGIPEIDRLTEAPEYLNQIVVPEMSEKSFDLDMFNDGYEWQFNSSSGVNVFHMTYRHLWAILDATSYVKTLLEETVGSADSARSADSSSSDSSSDDSSSDSSDDLYTSEDADKKDVMDRLPLHYLCSQDLGEMSEKIKSVIRRMGMHNEKDKRGFTPLDYLEKRASINISGIRDMLLAVERATRFTDMLEVVFAHLETGKKEKYTQTFEPEEFWQVTFKDATGRNMLHKAVIYECQDLVDSILRHDTRGEARTSRDAWGRTAYHYAYMFNNKSAISSLNIVKSKKDREYVQNGKCRDFDGKRIDDFHMDAKTAQEKRKQLVETINIVHNYHLLITWQYSLDVLNQKTGQDEDRRKLYWVRDIDTGFTHAHNSVLREITSEAKDIQEKAPQSFGADVTDVFGKRPLDYLSLSGSTYQEQIDAFFKELENANPQLTLKPQVDLVTMDMIEKQLERQKIEDSYYKLQTVSNPNRPKTGYFEDLLKQQQKSQSKKHQASDSGQATLSVPSRPNPRFTAAVDDSPYDAQYLKSSLGETLMGGLAAVTLTKPADPIEYLAHYLYKQAENASRHQQAEAERRLLEMERTAAENEEAQSRVLASEEQYLRRQLKPDVRNAQTTKAGIPVIAETEEH